MEVLTVVAKKRHSGFGFVSKDKVESRVSLPDLTLTDLVGPRKEIFPSKHKSTSSESSDHSNELIVSQENPSKHISSHASGSNQNRIEVTKCHIDKNLLPENVRPEFIHSETVVTENVPSKNPSKSAKGMSNVCSHKNFNENLVTVPNVITESNVENVRSTTENVKNPISVPPKSNADSGVKRSKSTCIDPQVSLVSNPSPVCGTHDEQETTPKVAFRSSSTKLEKMSFDEDDECGLLSCSEEETLVTTRVTRSSSKRRTKTASVSNVADVPLDEVSFHFEKGASLWKYVVKRKIVNEKELSQNTQECLDLMDLLLEAQQIKLYYDWVPSTRNWFMNLL